MIYARAVVSIVKVTVAAQMCVIVAVRLWLQRLYADSASGSSISVKRRASAFQRNAIRCGTCKCLALRNRSDDGADSQHEHGWGRAAQLEDIQNAADNVPIPVHCFAMICVSWLQRARKVYVDKLRTNNCSGHFARADQFSTICAYNQAQDRLRDTS